MTPPDPPKGVVFGSFWPLLGQKWLIFRWGLRMRSKKPILSPKIHFLDFVTHFWCLTHFFVQKPFFVSKTHFLCQKHIFLCLNTKFDILDEIFKNFFIFDNKIHFLLWINTICVWIHTKTKIWCQSDVFYHFFVKKKFL